MSEPLPPRPRSTALRLAAALAVAACLTVVPAPPSPASGSGGQTIWSGATRPVVASAATTGSRTLGTSFRVAGAGTITALRFYKSSRNRGTHTGSLWTADGHRLASVVYRGESRWGWQQAALSEPVAVQPGTTYVVSYTAPHGRYSRGRRLGTAEKSLSRGVAARSGLFGYGNRFPTVRRSYGLLADVRFLAAAPTAPPPSSTAGLTGCAADPGSCGYPDAASTGLEDGVVLKRVPEDVAEGPGWHWDRRGWLSIDGDGAVLSGLLVRGSIDVSASHVTVRNVKVELAYDTWGIGLRYGRDITIDHNEVSSPVGKGTGRLLVGVKDVYGQVSDVTVTHNDIWHASTGIQMENGLIQDNYIHDLGYQDGDHLNGITSNGGTEPMVIRHNTVLNSFEQTDAISLFQDFDKQANRTIDDNLVGGGGYTIYAGANPGRESGATNIVVTNNRFSTAYFDGSGHWGPATAYYHGGGNLWSGNFYDDSGDAVPAP